MNYLKTITLSLAAVALSSVAGKSQCPITDQDAFTSTAGWTQTDVVTDGNGTVRITGGVINMSSAEPLGTTCATSQGVHNNRAVRVFRPLNTTLSNTSFRANCRINIGGGNSVAHTLMGFTAGTAYPQGTNGQTQWACNPTQTPVSTTTFQDGIYVSLIAYGSNQFPNNFTDQPFPSAAIQTSTAAVPANLGWRIYAHTSNNTSAAFYWPAESAFNTTPIPTNQSKGISLPAVATNYWVRLERLSATNCKISVFSNAAMTTHVSGSPQCFNIDADIVGLNTFQNFGHMSGSYNRSIRGTVDDLEVFNNCPSIPGITLAPLNPVTCPGGSITLSATPGYSNYTWTYGTQTVTTPGNTLTVTPSATTVYTVTATYTGEGCPVQLTTTTTVTVVTPVLTPAISLQTTICSGQPVSPTGSATGNIPVSNHFWEMIECNQFGVPMGSPVYSFSQWYAGAPGAYTFPNSATVPCNKYYRVKLAVQNTPCVGWSETAQVIYVACTPAPYISGPTTVCYGGSVTLTAMNYPHGSTLYWTSSPATSGGPFTSGTVTFTPTVTTTYYVSVVTAYGCTGSASITVTPEVNNPAFNLGTNLNANDPFYTCAATPVVTNANANPNFGYAWIVEELDASNNVIANTTVSNPACWWGYGLGTCLFTGYNGTSTLGACNLPVSGQFTAGHKYRITRGTWITGVCPWQQYSVIVYESHSNSSQPVIIVEEDPFAPDYSAVMQQNTNVSAGTDAVSVLPNPSTGKLRVGMEKSSAGNYTIRIFNALGEQVFSETEINSGNTALNKELDLTGLQLPGGVYLVSVQTPETTITKRILFVQ